MVGVPPPVDVFRCLADDNNSVLFLKAVFAGSPYPHSKRGYLTRRLAVFGRVIRLFNAAMLSGKGAQACVRELLIESDYIPEVEIPSLLDQV